MYLISFSIISCAEKQEKPKNTIRRPTLVAFNNTTKKLLIDSMFPFYIFIQQTCLGYSKKGGDTLQATGFV